ncbi:Rossmann-like domain-containing protein [Corynebacterium heidelbergense]|nr:DUF364 domain-containing protein [Corynebacterium heidelbergense]
MHNSAEKPQGAANPMARTVADLVAAAIATESTADTPTAVRSVFYIEHGTRLGTRVGTGGEDVVYRNRYVLARIGTSFGACACEAGAVGPEVANFSGMSAADILTQAPAEVRMAVLDAWLAERAPHRSHPLATSVELPTGTPLQRALARDAAIVDLVAPQVGDTIAVVGVVTPLVEGLLRRGAHPRLCDRNAESCVGLPVEQDLDAVLTGADRVLATGMTVSDGSFDVIRQHCLSTTTPLYIYAQSGTAIVREFLGAGVRGMTAEHFPFSQFSADATPMYVYRSGQEGTREL